MDKPKAVSPAEPKPDLLFAAAGCDVKQGKFDTIARAKSATFAKRIANALNAYKPDRRGQ